MCACLFGQALACACLLSSHNAKLCRTRRRSRCSQQREEDTAARGEGWEAGAEPAQPSSPDSLLLFSHSSTSSLGRSQASGRDPVRALYATDSTCGAQRCC